jgi:hypothetical protein
VSKQETFFQQLLKQGTKNICLIEQNYFENEKVSVKKEYLDLFTRSHSTNLDPFERFDC